MAQDRTYGNPPHLNVGGASKTKRLTKADIIARVARKERKDKASGAGKGRFGMPHNERMKYPAAFAKTLRKILRALSQGCTGDMAARLAGVPPPTFWKWKRTGRELGERMRAGETLTPEQMYLLDFDEKCQRAVTAFGNLHLRNIERGALTDPVRGPEHSKWLLTHHPQLRKAYGEQARVEHTGKDGKPIETRTSVTLADLQLAMQPAQGNVLQHVPTPELEEKQESE